MASSLHQVVTNSLWFAFDALDQHKTGVVDKTRLKELTRHIGEALGLERAVEDCLADYRSTDTLTFDQFLHFLEYEVFSDVCSRDTPYREVERHHTALDTLFWEVGRHSLARRYPALLTPPDTYKMFRVFCLLADRNPASGDLLQVALRRSEVCEVCRQLVDGLGLDWDWTDWQMVSGAINSFPLPVFLTFLEGRYGHNTEPSALSEAVDYTYKCFVGQAFFQGRAYQRITRAGGWIRRDIEVTPWCVRASGDISEDLPDEGQKTSQSPSPGKITAAVGRSLTLGRNAVGVMGGAVRSGVTEVVERSRTLTRNSQSPASARGEQGNGTNAKRGFSLGRWGSTSGINNKKRDREQTDTSSLGGGRGTPSPMIDTRRSHTLDRASLRSAKSSTTIGVETSSTTSSLRSPGGGKPVISPRPAKESTKGIVGGVIGRVWKLEITPETTITSLKDSASGRPCKISIINTPTARPIVLAAQDHKSKARLLAALQESVKHCMDALPYQMRLSLARRCEEEEEELRACEERIRRSSQADIIEQTQAELAAERTAREEAECLAQTEAVARVAEEGRVQELTTLRQQLEALLQQETQAKRDEEIVRNLQARVLREEWAKREELERLQQEQQQLLEEEQRKRRAFEILQQDQEKKLREAEGRLKILDGDRRRLDEELRAAREKIVLSGRGKQLLEARMKVQEGRRPPVRTLSLRPSRQERASPARSSSFTTAPPSRLQPSSPSGYNRPPTGPSLSPSSTIGGANPDGALSSLSPASSTSRHSASSTPTTSPSAAQANRSILEYLENGSMNGGGGGSPGAVSPGSNTSPSHPSIPEHKGEEEEVLDTIGWKIKDVEPSVTTNGTAALKTDGAGDTPQDSFLDSSAEGGDTTVTLNTGLKLPKLSVTSEPDDGDAASNDDNLLLDQGKQYIEIKTYEDKPMDVDGETPVTNDSTVVTTTIVSKVLTSDAPESAMDLLDDIKNSIGGITVSGDDVDDSGQTTVITETTTKTISSDDGAIVEQVTTVNQENSLSNSADLM